MALLAIALLGACSGGKDKAAVIQVDEKPRVKLAAVTARRGQSLRLCGTVRNLGFLRVGSKGAHYESEHDK